MRRRIITTLLKKDLTLFTRDRFYFLLTVVALIMYVAVYFVMPRTNSDVLKLGILAPSLTAASPLDLALANQQGIDLQVFQTLDELKAAVTKNECPIAIVVPEDFLGQLSGPNTPTLTIYLASATPEEVTSSVSAMIRQFAASLTGQQADVQINTTVLGNDLMGAQLPWRDRLVPMMVVLILGTEVLSLASLITTELAQNTVKALLVTPLNINHLLLEKAILGIGLAFIQVALFVVVVGGLTGEPLAMLTLLLIGCVLVTGLGFLVASLARDLMGVTSWGMIAMVVFVIPSFGGLVPGLLSGWATFLPSYYLTDALARLTNYGATFGSIGTDFLNMLGWSAGFAVIGVFTLKRRYA